MTFAVVGCGGGASASTHFASPSGTTGSGPSGNPGPSPTPTPGPNPNPNPTPTPAPVPGPNPTPTPVSGPNPNPTPTPAPGPTPTPNPNPAPSPTPTPTPPPGSVVLQDIQKNDWLTCGACGNTGGGGALANFSFALGITSPSEDSIATEFSISSNTAFANAYFFQQHGPVTSQINSLTYEFDLFIPNGLENAPQAIEFECQQTLNGWVYNFAFQADYSSNQWRIFDYGAKQWDNSGLPLVRFSPGTWHHLIAEYHNDTTGHVVIHDALTIDGVRHVFNIRHNAFNSGGGNQFSNAVQLDTNSQTTPYKIFVDKMNIIHF
jgi:hypothetical protein